MKRIVLLSLSILLPLSMAAIVLCAQTDSAQAEIRAAEDAWNKAELNHDAPALSRLMSDDLVLTETDGNVINDWTKWSKTYTDVLNNWCRSAVAWNVATDEHGEPNIGPYPCGDILNHQYSYSRSDPQRAVLGPGTLFPCDSPRSAAIRIPKPGSQSGSYRGRESGRPKSPHTHKPRSCTDGSGQPGTAFGQSHAGREFGRDVGLEVISIEWGDHNQG